MPPKKVKRADVRYQVSIVTGRTEAGKPVKKYFYGKTQKEANQKRDEYLEGIAVSTDARTMTVRRWANIWLERYSRGGYRNQRTTGQSSACSSTSSETRRTGPSAS